MADTTTREQAQSRLSELQREYEVGQRRLQEVMAQEVTLRETLLRISGAIQVLEELTGRPSDEPAPAMASTNDGGSVLKVG
ncbi:hypothetical protein ACFWUU_12850 [Kribbella sp. NPDC058693]|uniref:hypothetical protein n=1 Tax=Kribbella sp. NPDC058693 TaxID=3346602 RepID=UPI00364B77C1